ncbi:MAG: GNAT family N-acetyltransferase, partial [Bradymonadaceae bacterium]
GIFQDTFRGLQMSYHDDYRDHSPGSLAQLALIENLCEEGIRSYDLGSDMEYKRQWAEEGLGTVALIVRK